MAEHVPDAAELRFLAGGPDDVIHSLPKVLGLALGHERPGQVCSEVAFDHARSSPAIGCSTDSEPFRRFIPEAAMLDV